MEVGGGVTVTVNSDPGYVYALAAMNGILYAGGEFDKAGTVAATNVARWDGTNWSAMGNGLRGRVWSLTFHRDALFAANGGGIHRWDNTNWTMISTNVRCRVIASVGNDLYAGGRFDAMDGVSATNIARWDGTNWWPLGSGVDAGSSGSAGVYGIAAWKNEVTLSGVFNTAGGNPSTNFAVWHLPAPDISVTTNQIEVIWWKGFTNYVLEASDTLPASNWTPIATLPNTNYYTTPASGTKKFFRLRQE